jgi:hypothetical protein
VKIVSGETTVKGFSDSHFKMAERERRETMIDYENIFNQAFAPVEDSPLVEFIVDMVEKEDPEGENHRNFFNAYIKANQNTLELESKVNDLIQKSIYAGFMTGFALGQEFDVTDLETAKHLQALKSNLKERGTVPLWPRTKGFLNGEAYILTAE